MTPPIRHAIPRAANPTLAGSGATEAAMDAVPMGVPAGRGTPNTALIWDANTEFNDNDVVPPEEAISNRATLLVLLPPALTVPNRMLFVRLMLKLVNEAVLAFCARFNPPECVMLVVVSPPVIGKVAATGEVFSVAGLTGVMLNPAPVRTESVDVLKVTVVVPPVIGVA